MKKWIESSIAVVCIAVMTACGGGNGGGGNTTNEEGVVGKWKAKVTKAEKVGKIETTVLLDLNADNTMSFNVQALLDGEEKGIKIRIPMEMGYDGKWDASADKMKWTPDTATSHFSIDKDSIVFSLPNPKLEAMVNIIKDALVEELQKSKKTNIMLTFDKDSLNYFFDKSQLVIVSGNDTLRFDKN